MSNNRQKLKPELGLFDATAISVGAIIGAGIFVVTGIVAGMAGPALIVSMLIAATVSLFTALSFSELTAWLPREGSVYEFSYRLISPFAGFTAGWVWILGNVFGGAAVALGFGNYLSILFPSIQPKLIAALLCLLQSWELQTFRSILRGRDLRRLLYLLCLWGICKSICSRRRGEGCGAYSSEGDIIIAIDINDLLPRNRHCRSWIGWSNWSFQLGLATGKGNWRNWKYRSRLPDYYRRPHGYSKCPAYIYFGSVSRGIRNDTQESSAGCNRAASPEIRYAVLRHLDIRHCDDVVRPLRRSWACGCSEHLRPAGLLLPCKYL